MPGHRLFVGFLTLIVMIRLASAQPPGPPQSSPVPIPVPPPTPMPAPSSGAKAHWEILIDGRVQSRTATEAEAQALIPKYEKLYKKTATVRGPIYTSSPDTKSAPTPSPQGPKPSPDPTPQP